jgi:hypothetical protein
MFPSDNKAFAPFFSDVCEYTAKRPNGRILRTSLKCCVDDGGLDDTTSDISSSSIIRVVYVSFLSADWPWREFHAQIGDSVSVGHGYSFFCGVVEQVAKGCDGSTVLTCKGPSSNGKR